MLSERGQAAKPCKRYSTGQASRRTPSAALWQRSSSSALLRVRGVSLVWLGNRIFQILSCVGSLISGQVLRFASSRGLKFCRRSGGSVTRFRDQRFGSPDRDVEQVSKEKQGFIYAGAQAFTRILVRIQQMLLPTRRHAMLRVAHKANDDLPSCGTNNPDNLMDVVIETQHNIPFTPPNAGMRVSRPSTKMDRSVNDSWESSYPSLLWVHAQPPWFDGSSTSVLGSPHTRFTQRLQWLPDC